MKKIFFSVFILFQLTTYSLPDNELEKIKEANEKVLNSQYQDAISIYKNVFENNFKTPQKLSDIDSKFKTVINENINMLETLIIIKDILPYMKNAINKENENIIEAFKNYSAVINILKEKRINRIKYSIYILDGSLEEFIKNKIEEQKENLNPEFILKVNQDKKRKKKIGFYRFETDKSVNFDFQTIIIDNLLNLLERKNIINIVEKPFNGSFDNMIEWAKKNNLDFILTGNYRKEKRNNIEFNFYIMDIITQKKLIETTLIMPLTREFFYTLDNIINIVEKNLINYSRLEDVLTIKIVKEGEKGALKSEVEDDAKELEIISYLKSRISDITENFIKTNKDKKDIKLYNDIIEIIEYNNNFGLKTINNLTSNSNTVKEIKDTIKLNTGAKELDELKENKEYEKYLDKYDNVEKNIKEIKIKYVKLSIFVDEIANELKNDRDSIVIIAGDRKKIYKIGLIFGTFDMVSLNYLKSSYADFYPEINQHIIMYAGLTYEKIIRKDLFFISGLLINPHSIVLETKDFYPGVGIGLRLALKYYISSTISINNIYDISYPIISYKSVKPNDFIITYNLGFGFALGDTTSLNIYGLYNTNNISYKDSSGFTSFYEGSYKRRGIGADITFHFNKIKDISLEEKQQKNDSIIKEIIIISIYSPFDITGLSLNSSARVYTLGLGVGITIFKDKLFKLGLDVQEFTVFNSIIKDSSDKIFPYLTYMGVFTEIKPLTIRGINFIFGVTAGFSYIIKEGVKNVIESNGLIADDVSSFHFHTGPYIGIGFELFKDTYLQLSTERRISIPDDINPSYIYKLMISLSF